MAFVNITPTTTFKASLFYFAILEMVKPSPALIPFILHYSFVPNCRGGGGSNGKVLGLFNYYKRMT